MRTAGVGCKTGASAILTFLATTHHARFGLMGERHYGQKVILPRRIKADVVDGAVTAVILIVPLLVGQAIAGHAPDPVLRATLLSIPAGILYSILRDAIGGGTSLGKRAMGLTIIRLDDGRACTPRHVWARDLLDPIPMLSLVDFIGMCVDRRGQKLMDKWLGVQVIEGSRTAVDAARSRRGR